MKKLYSFQLFLILVLVTIEARLAACPACVGRLDKATPPFFTQEYDAHCQSSQAKTSTSTAENNPDDEPKKEKES